LSNVQIFPLLGGFAPVSRAFAALALARIVALYQVDQPAPAPQPSIQTIPQPQEQPDETQTPI
jgi:hypothetical protein